MRFVKDRDGFSAQGNSDARFIADSPVPFLSRRRPQMGDQPASVATKKNGFLEVTLEQLAGDGFYSIGRVDGVYHVVASTTAKNNFADRGEFVASTGFASTTRIRPYGRGLGSELTNTIAGTATDFDSRSLTAFDAQVFRTRNGRAWTPHYTFNFIQPYSNGAFVVPLNGEVYGPSGARKFQNTIGCMSLDGSGQHRLNFIRDDGTSQTLGNTIDVPNQLAAWALPVRLGPGKYLMLGGYHRATYLGSTVIAADNPGLTFQFSDDGGDTWFPDSSHELFHEFFDTVMPLAGGYNADFNAAVNMVGLNTAPLSNRFSVAYALVPYCPGTPFPNTVKCKVKLGLIDNASRTLLGTATLFDGAPNAANAYWSGGCVGVKGGVMLVTRPLTTTYADLNTQPPVFEFTADGISHAVTGTGPQPNYKTGLVSAISPTQIVLPMHDGAHSLFESRDHGATWRKRGTLSSAGPVPTPVADTFTMADFAVLTMLRLNGQPASSAPGTPWVSDSRIEAPVL